MYCVRIDIGSDLLSSLSNGRVAIKALYISSWSMCTVSKDVRLIIRGVSPHNFFHALGFRFMRASSLVLLQMRTKHSRVQQLKHRFPTLPIDADK